MALSNPLENPLILQQIFDYCPSIQTLKSCRLVSKRWLDLSLDNWRKDAVLIIYDEDNETGSSYLSYSGRSDHDNTVTVEERQVGSSIKRVGVYVKDLNKLLVNLDSVEAFELDRKPFRCFKLKSFARDAMALEGRHAGFLFGSAAFLRNHWTSLSHLELNKCSFSYKHLADLLFNRVPNLTTLKLINTQVELVLLMEGPRKELESMRLQPHLNLKALHLDTREVVYPTFFGSYYGNGGHRDMLLYFWNHLLTRLPKLEELKLRSWSKAADLLALQVMKEIRSKDRSQLNLRRIQYFDLDRVESSMEQSLVSTFNHLKLPLEFLGIDFGCSTSPLVVHNFLEVHKQTLKALQVFRGPDQQNDLLRSRSRDEVNGPYPFRPDFAMAMEFLTELTLVNGLHWGFQFLRCLNAPNLLKLKILETPENKQDWKGYYGVLNSTLEKAFCSSNQLPWILHGFTQDSLRQFEFHHESISLSTGDLEALAQSFPNLTGLEVSLGAETFPLVCERWPNLSALSILRNTNNFRLDDESFTGIISSKTEKVKGPRAHPNITDLKHLQRLSIEPSIAAHLTDRSVFGGLLQLPCLHSLQARLEQISAEARNTLRESGIVFFCK